MKKILLDVVPVLVGILLALIINNWRQSSSEQRYIESSVASIIKENEENILELKHALERQAIFMDTLQFYLDDDDKSLIHIIKKTNGVYTPDLKSSTWQFLIQDSKHTLVPYEFINRLAEIEKYEKMVARYNDLVSDLIFQVDFFDEPKLKRVAYILFSDFGPNENAMIKELEDFNTYARKQFALGE